MVKLAVTIVRNEQSPIQSIVNHTDPDYPYTYITWTLSGHLASPHNWHLTVILFNLFFLGCFVAKRGLDLEEYGPILY